MTEPRKITHTRARARKGGRKDGGGCFGDGRAANPTAKTTRGRAHARTCSHGKTGAGEARRLVFTQPCAPTLLHPEKRRGEIRTRGCGDGCCISRLGVCVMLVEAISTSHPSADRSLPLPLPLPPRPCRCRFVSVLDPGWGPREREICGDV